MKPILRMFLYGTLRFGECNFGMFEDACLSHTEATTPGRLYLAMHRGRYVGYPFADFTEDGTVVGDVLTLDPRIYSVTEAIQIEINAGYVPVSIRCKLRESGFYVDCIAFHFPHQKIGRLERGPYAEDGDWRAAHKQIMEGVQ